MEMRDKKNQASDTAQAARGSGEIGGGTSTTGTGEGDHQHRGAEPWGGVGLGLHQGLLQQKAIADRPSSAAMAPPWSSRWTGRPALRWSRVEAMRC